MLGYEDIADITLQGGTIGNCQVPFQTYQLSSTTTVETFTLDQYPREDCVPCPNSVKSPAEQGEKESWREMSSASQTSPTWDAGHITEWIRSMTAWLQEYGNNGWICTNPFPKGFWVFLGGKLRWHSQQEYRLSLPKTFFWPTRVEKREPLIALTLGSRVIQMSLKLRLWSGGRT